MTAPKKHTRKTTRYVLLALLLIVLAAGWWAWRWWHTKPLEERKEILLPTLEKSIYRITSITDSTTILSSQLIIDNPLPASMKIHHLEYSLQMDGVEILKDTYAKSLEVRAKGKDTLTLPMTLLNKNLIAITKKLGNQKADSTLYTIKTTFYLDVPIVGKKEIALTRERKLPVYYIPEIKIEKLKLKKFGFRKSELLAELRVINKNAFAYVFSKPKYELKLGKQESFLKGEFPDFTNIAAHSNKVYPVTIELNVKDLPEVAWQYLKEGKDMAYVFYFSGFMESEESLIDHSSIVAVTKGNLKDMKELKEAAETPPAR